MFSSIPKRILSTASGAGSKRGLLVLTYHRTLESYDPYVSDVTGDVFEIHAQMLSRFCNVLRLDEAAAMLAERRLPPRAVVITFDDGYADNHNIALPILLRYGLKATFFIATGYLGGGVMWNDVIINAVRSASDDAIRNYLKRQGDECRLANTDTRKRLIRQRIQSLKYQGPTDRDRAAKELSQLLNVREGKPLMMTKNEVRRLASMGMEIGAHTETHPILTRLPLDKAEQEIINSRKTLEEITGNAVTSFAFPNGIPGRDFDETHLDILRRHGFTAAVTTSAARADYSNDLLQIPRIGLWHDHRWKLYASLLRAYAQRSS